MRTKTEIPKERALKIINRFAKKLNITVVEDARLGRSGCYRIMSILDPNLVILDNISNLEDVAEAVGIYADLFVKNAQRMKLALNR